VTRGRDAPESTARSEARISSVRRQPHALSALMRRGGGAARAALARAALLLTLALCAAAAAAPSASQAPSGALACARRRDAPANALAHQPLCMFDALRSPAPRSAAC